jgi:hypothetical protein
VRIFSRSDPDEQLRVRIDDKLSRLARGNPDAFGEDVILDLVGCLVLAARPPRPQRKRETAWT